MKIVFSASPSRSGRCFKSNTPPRRISWERIIGRALPRIVRRRYGRIGQVLVTHSAIFLAALHNVTGHTSLATVAEKSPVSFSLAPCLLVVFRYFSLPGDSLGVNAPLGRGLPRVLLRVARYTSINRQLRMQFFQGPLREREIITESDCRVARVFIHPSIRDRRASIFTRSLRGNLIYSILM